MPAWRTIWSRRTTGTAREGVSSVKLYYHSEEDGYRIFYAQFSDGTSMNYGEDC